MIRNSIDSYLEYLKYQKNYSELKYKKINDDYGVIKFDNRFIIVDITVFNDDNWLKNKIKSKIK